MKDFQKGLTVLELMATLAVAATLTAVGVPQFRGLALDMRRSEVTGRLFNDLQQARMEAVTRNADVVIAAADGDWSGGWTVFVDADGDDAPDGEPLLESEAVHDALLIQADVPETGLRFQASGRALQPSGFVLCGDGERHSRRIAIDLSGRILVREMRDHPGDYEATCPAA